MDAKIRIEKSFDKEGREFCKEWQAGDFREFFEEEGDYLDSLGDVLKAKGKEGESFTVIYTVTLAK